MSDTLHFAFQYRDMGFSILPLRGKKPAIASWRDLTRRPTRRDITTWFSGRRESFANIGIICGRVSRIIAVDVDDEHAAASLRALLPETAMMTRTARGIHLFYQIEAESLIPTRVRLHRMKIDIRGEGSYVVAAPSIHPVTRMRYEQIGSWNLSEVPFFDAAWLSADESQNKPQTTQPQTPTSHARIKNAPRYISQIIAISGHGGHNATFRAACKLRDAGMSREESLAALIAWNKTNARPPWTVRDLLHKVESAFKNRTCS